MTLVVEVPQGWEPERRYIADVVLGEWLGLDWRMRVGDRRDVLVSLDGDGSGASLSMPDVLFATRPEAWLTAESLPRPPLLRREGLPVVYGTGAADDPLLRVRGATAELTVDVLGTAFFMLTRLEEHVVATRAEPGRFPASASLAHAESFVDIPIVDRYVDVLWDALERLWPRLERRPRRYAAALTHDVDDPLSWRGRSPYALLRQLGADALQRRDAALALRRVRSWARTIRGDNRIDPYNTFDLLMDVSERHGLRSAFYFLVADGAPGAENPPYSLDDPWVEALISRIHSRGHEIGFHAIDLDAERTTLGFSRLRDKARRLGVDQSAWGGRMHYLRWENPRTWAAWERAGLDYDVTLAYADRIGFRTGTSHEFSVYDLVQRRQLRLRERPFQVMDRTLSEYMGLDSEAAIAAVQDVAGQCRRHGGVFSLLWHNSVLLTAGQKRDYQRLVAAVAAP